MRNRFLAAEFRAFHVRLRLSMASIGRCDKDERMSEEVVGGGSRGRNGDLMSIMRRRQGGRRSCSASWRFIEWGTVRRCSGSSVGYVVINLEGSEYPRYTLHLVCEEP